MEIYTSYGRDFDSSMLETAMYTPDTKELEVTFKSNGAQYRYDGVPEDVVNDFFNAESAGKFFIKNIKDKYETTRL